MTTFEKVFSTTKLIVLIAVISFVVFAGVKVYSKVDNYFDQSAKIEALKLEQERQEKKYAENLARAETKIVSSLKNEISALNKQNSAALNQMLAEIKQRDEKINNIGQTVTKLNENVTDLRVKADHVYKPGSGDPNEQYFKKIYYRTKDEYGNELEAPIAWSIYSPNKPENERWKTGVYPIEFKSEVIQAEQKDGQINTYTKLWFENNKDSESRGRQIPVNIVSSEYKQLKDDTKSMMWWAPRVSLNVDAGYGSSNGAIGAAGLSFSFSGYGKSRSDLDWRFFDFGVSTNGDDTYAKFTPFAYNIGKPLPVVDNLFLGPFVGLGTGGDKIVGLGLSIPF